MADREHRQLDLGHYQQRPGGDAFKDVSKSKVLAVVTLLPVGGTLLLLAGLSFAGSLVALALTTPLFVIFSPVLIPAALTVALAITGFLTSGAFGITALSSISWIIKYLRQTGVPEQLDHAKRRAQDTAGQMGQKAREVGHRAQESTK